MNMMCTNSLYVISRSVQSIWIFWHDLLISQMSDCCEICHFILTWLQMLHWVIDESWSTISKKFFSSLWRLMNSEWFMWACQSFSSSLNADQKFHEIDFHFQIFLTVSVIELSFSSSICWSCLFFNVQTSKESLSWKRKLLIVFQWISFSLRSSNDTRFVTKSVQKITFFNLKIFFLSFFFVIWSITLSYLKIDTFNHSAITYSFFEVFQKFENQERSLYTWIMISEFRIIKFLRDETVI